MQPAQDYRQHTRHLAWGLNLAEPDLTTPEEIAEFRRISAAQLGVQQDGLDFWLDAAPDVLKRYRLWADSLRVRESDESPAKWNASGPATMYVYAATGFEEGIRYSLFGMNRIMTKAQIIEQLALVFRYAGPRGMVPLARAARSHEWREPSEAVRWPSGWGPDPEIFRSGADFRSPETTAADVENIVAWYKRWMGEVPRHVTFLARYRPELLKAYRNRYENTLRLLPKQAEPWTLLQVSIYRGFADGVREGMLLAKGFGVTKSQIIEAVSRATFHSGQQALNLVDRVAGDVLDAWPD
jgi:hypothetical protein